MENSTRPVELVDTATATQNNANNINNNDNNGGNVQTSLSELQGPQLTEPPPIYSSEPAMGVSGGQKEAVEGQKVTALKDLGSPMPPIKYIECPFCHKVARPRVVQNGENAQVVLGAILCLICVCLACVPCMMHMFEEKHWHCSECNREVAKQAENGPVTPLA